MQRNCGIAGTTTTHLATVLSAKDCICGACGKLYILILLTKRPVHYPEITAETIITITGFLGAIMLLLDVIALRWTRLISKNRRSIPRDIDAGAFPTDPPNWFFSFCEKEGRRGSGRRNKDLISPPMADVHHYGLIMVYGWLTKVMLAFILFNFFGIFNMFIGEQL